MSQVEIVRPVPVEESRAWVAAMYTTFVEDAEAAARLDEWRARTWDAARTWGARADGRWVATLRTRPVTVSVPLSRDVIPADALTAVTVAGTHRRQGLLSRMLGESLAEAVGRGDPVSILVAAEWPIYGRFGYAPAVDSGHYTLRTRRPGSVLLDAPERGHIRQVSPEQLRESAPGVFERARLERAGNISRDGDWWDRTLAVAGVPRHGKEPAYLVHDGPDGIDGYLGWTPTEPAWDETGDLAVISVGELVAATPAAEHALWGYLLDLDLVTDVLLRHRPVDENLPRWLSDGRTYRQTHRGDRMWVRLLDVAAALTARRYSVDGEVVLEVVDDDGAGYAAGTYRLAGGPSAASCAPTTAAAELRVHQRALASAYLGGVSLTALVAAGQVTELRPGALLRADAMFRTPIAPWCGTEF